MYTDHSAVKAVLLAPNPSGKHARWWTQVYGSGIQEVDIVYRPGKKCANVDALSRSPVEDPSADVTLEGNSEIRIGAVQSKTSSITDNISELLCTVPGTSKPIVLLAEQQQKDAYLSAMSTFLKEKRLPEDPTKARRIALQAPLFTVAEGLLCFIDPRPTHRKQIAVPEHLRQGLLDKTHRNRMGVHFSGQRTPLFFNGSGMACMPMPSSSPRAVLNASLLRGEEDTARHPYDQSLFLDPFRW